MGPKTRSPISRFITKFDIDPVSGCWVWNAGRFPKGYAAFHLGNGKLGYGHRFSYEWFVGPIPEGTELDHLCRNRPCVNFAHLEPVTHVVNVQRGELGKAKREMTACKYGHEFTEANTWRRANGQRQCRACNARRQRATNARKRLPM